MNFKNIHIGNIIETRVFESGIELSRICQFMKCSEEEINEMFLQQNLLTDVLLKWSKLLEYDFFRIYCQHLILYAPPSGEKTSDLTVKSSLPVFRKSLYTQEIINYILDEISSGAMTKNEVIEKYRIPKTTLHKWISKNKGKLL